MGGWVRLLRHATADDLTTTVFGRHHSPSSGTAINEPPNQWYLAQSLEGYLGYVRKGDLKLYDDFTVPDGLVETPTEAVAAGKKVAVPAGALVYRHGDSWELFEGGILPKSARVHSLEPHIAANDIKASMKPFMDTKYVWGGTTDHGIDCSGFTQFFLRLRGASVPRDAEEQATSGFIVAWGDDIAKKAKPGDIIFFTSESGRISHVAISLGGNDIIHSAGEGVHFSKLSDARHGNPDDTLLEGAIFARRIIVR
jgi:cell wall-associated NlpC family hydrolase